MYIFKQDMVSRTDFQEWCLQTFLQQCSSSHLAHPARFQSPRDCVYSGITYLFQGDSERSFGFYSQRFSPFLRSHRSQSQLSKTTLFPSLMVGWHQSHHKTQKVVAKDLRQEQVVEFICVTTLLLCQSMNFIALSIKWGKVFVYYQCFQL